MQGPMVISGFTGRMTPSIIEKPVRFERLDKVRLGSGQVMIVTGYHPNRPANPYSGVVENGQGAEYKFGPKHRPVKIGTVTDGHPALLNLKTRQAAKGGSGLDAGTTAAVRKLVAAVEQGDLTTAKVLAEMIKSVVG